MLVYWVRVPVLLNDFQQLSRNEIPDSFTGFTYPIHRLWLNWTSYLHKGNKRILVTEYLHITSSVVVSFMMLISLSGTFSFLKTSTNTVTFRKSEACVCLWYVRSLPPRLCVHHSLIHSRQLHYLSLSRAHKSQTGKTSEIFQYIYNIILIMAMIHYSDVYNNIIMLIA